MKIGIFSIPQITPGKYNIKDDRLNQVYKITRSKKITYMHTEVTREDALLEADVILTPRDRLTDLILKDLEFVETRSGRSEQEQEKALLNRFKTILEKEEPLFSLTLSEDEQKLLSGYGLLTVKPIVIAEKSELENIDILLMKAFKDSGFINFFTTGEKETRAWIIQKGTTAWEAAGAIHSDIQKGFIRAEIISFNDFIQAGGETQAKQAGKLRLEQKEYVMQDADLANFRFNK